LVHCCVLAQCEGSVSRLWCGRGVDSKAPRNLCPRCWPVTRWRA